MRAERAARSWVYAEEVRTRRFPAPEHSYGIAPEEMETLRAQLPTRRTAPA